MCRVQSFCFCCSIRVGTIAAAILSCFYIAITAIDGALSCKDAYDAYKNKDYRLFKEHLMTAQLPLMMSLMLFIVVAFLIMSVMKSRSGYSLPWLATILLLVTFLVVNAVWKAVDVGDVSKMSVIAIIVLSMNVFYLVFMVYLWMVVMSYYKQLREVE